MDRRVLMVWTKKVWTTGVVLAIALSVASSGAAVGAVDGQGPSDGRSGNGADGGCGEQWFLYDECSFSATGSTLEFWAWAGCPIDTGANCYFSALRLDVWVEGVPVDSCTEFFPSLAPASCSGTLEVAPGEQVTCRVAGTFTVLVGSWQPEYGCRTLNSGP